MLNDLRTVEDNCNENPTIKWSPEVESHSYNQLTNSFTVNDTKYGHDRRLTMGSMPIKLDWNDSDKMDESSRFTGTPGRAVIIDNEITNKELTTTTEDNKRSNSVLLVLYTLGMLACTSLYI